MDYYFEGGIILLIFGKSGMSPIHPGKPGSGTDLLAARKGINLEDRLKGRPPSITT